MSINQSFINQNISLQSRYVLTPLGNFYKISMNTQKREIRYRIQLNKRK
jgi:hypothetical protein